MSANTLRTAKTHARTCGPGPVRVAAAVPASHRSTPHCRSVFPIPQAGHRRCTACHARTAPQAAEHDDDLGVLAAMLHVAQVSGIIYVVVVQVSGILKVQQTQSSVTVTAKQTRHFTQAQAQPSTPAVVEPSLVSAQPLALALSLACSFVLSLARYVLLVSTGGPAPKFRAKFSSGPNRWQPVMTICSSLARLNVPDFDKDRVEHPMLISLLVVYADLAAKAREHPALMAPHPQSKSMGSAASWARCRRAC